VSDAVLTNISVNSTMAAIGDSDGTVHMMSLCKTLYEQSAKEKEVMLTIFDREFRREKNLEVARKQAELKKPMDKKKGEKDRNAERLEAQISDIETKFFEQFPEEEGYQKRSGGDAVQPEADLPDQQ
jgi:phosphomannomutase